MTTSTIQLINLGTSANDGTGDSIRYSFDLINQNFELLANSINGGDGIHFLKLVDTPHALIPSTNNSPVMLISDYTGSTLTQRSLVGGFGINISTVGSTVTLSVNSTTTELYNFSLESDLHPLLGNSLDGNGFIATGFADPVGPTDLVNKRFFESNIPTAIDMAGTLEDIAISSPSPTTPQWKQGSSASAANTFVARNELGDVYVNNVHANVIHSAGIINSGSLTVNTNKFTVDATNGNVSVAGNVSVNGSIVTTGTFSGSSISVNSISHAGVNSIGDIGTVGNRFGTVWGTTFDGVATKAQYADLAENYASDAIYEPGTVLVFGGENEVTISTTYMDRAVAGVVSTNPAYLMNSMQESGTPVALVGRVPCKVIGIVKKGDLLVTSAIQGVATVNNNPTIGTVIGKSLEDYVGTDIATIATIEVVVGRV